MRNVILTIAFLLCCCISAQAQRGRLYVNPIQARIDVDNNTSKRIQRSVLLGLSRAKHVVVTHGSVAKDNATLQAEGYDFALTPVIVKASVEQDTELLSDKKKDSYTASQEVSFVLTVLASGRQTASPYTTSASDKYSQMASYKAAEKFTEGAIDFVDEKLVLTGTILEVVSLDSKDKEAKQVRVDIGSSDGIRKGMMFDVYKAAGDKDAAEAAALQGNATLLGKARCEQIVNANESYLKVYGSKDGDMAVLEALQNMVDDTSYNIVVVSRAIGEWGKVGKGIADAVTAKKERGNYYEPDFSRVAKLRVGLMGCTSGNSNVSSSDVELLLKNAVKALGKVTTIDFTSTAYSSVEQAQAAGLDGLIDISFDNKEEGTERTKDGKTNYTVNVAISLAGINVHTGEWLEMRSYEQPYSGEDRSSLLTKSVEGLADDIKKFAEDVYPVAGTIVEITEIKKNKAKKASINIGSNVGVRKNMMFDIYEQTLDGDAESRILLGTGKVSGDPAADSAIINVKGSNDGDSRLLELIQNQDGTIEAVIISRAHIDRLGTMLDNLGGLGKLL